MAAFDATIRVGEVAVEIQEDEKGNAYSAQLVLGVLTIIPLGPEQVVPVPLGVVRVPLSKDSLDALGAEINEAAERVQRKPDIQIASNLGAVENAAERIKKATG